MSNINSDDLLVSVIIPCYNHSLYLPQAIESVLNQSYRHVEIIVIDDGSVDETARVAKNYKQVKYYYQQNRGLSASRNRGVELSNGEFIVFLDADDWLLAEAVQSNLDQLKQHPSAAFVSGSHVLYYQPEEKKWDMIKEVEADHYQQLLLGNYIGMPSAVMYQRWATLEFPFNTSLKNCEDYEQYFRISRKYPVFHHIGLIAVYRLHGTNKSGNIPVQLETSLNILRSQEPFLRNKEEKKKLLTGIYWLEEYYCKKMYEDLVHRLYTTKSEVKNPEINMLKKYRPAFYKKYKVEVKVAEKHFLTQQENN